jgi:hypothetical protein
MKLQKITALNSSSEFSMLYNISLRLEKAYNIGNDIRKNSINEDIELGIKLDNVLINLEKVNNALFHFEKNYLVQDFNDIIFGKHYLN